MGRAIPLDEQTLADRQRVLGDDHPDTLASRSNLVGAYQAAGNLGRAIPLPGTEQTARHDGDLARPLMAVPGLVTSVMPAGCYTLIRERRADCATSTADITKHILSARP